MPPDEERWAEALAIERSQGSSAYDWVIDRITKLRPDGDDAGVARLAEVAGRPDQRKTGRTLPQGDQVCAGSAFPLASGPFSRSQRCERSFSGV
jgi:hypothetical protein